MKQVEVRTTEFKDGSILDWSISVRKDMYTEYHLTTSDSVVAEVAIAICQGFTCKEYTEEHDKFFNYRYRVWEVG